MARLTRLVVPGEAHLVKQSAIDGEKPFDQATDCEDFLACLRRAATERGVAVHGYVLLPSSWLLICTPTDADSLARMMQALSRWFVTAYNRRHAREGKLWRARLLTPPLV